MFKEYENLKQVFNNNFIDLFPESKFNDILNYSINQGKRVRPILLLATYEMLSGEKFNKDVLDFAMALELIHNYSLVHDDLPSMDNDDYRRGRLTTHKKFGEAKAILAGDSLLNFSYELMLSTIKSKSTNISMLSKANAAFIIAKESGIDGMVGGQVIDIEDKLSSLEDVISMYDKKTCGLIKSATIAAGYLAEVNENVLEDMSNLGRYIGLSFQIQDDILDYPEDEKIGKITYITFAGLEQSKLDIIDYSTKAIEILNKYENNSFLLTLVKKLINREI